MDGKDPVRFSTENDVFEELFNKAIKERRQVIKEPYERVRDIFKEQNLLKEENALKNNILMLKCKKNFLYLL